MSLVDRATLRVHGGRGARGAATFMAQPFEPHGGPDGGDGGSGGSVILKAQESVPGLVDFLRSHVRRAADGTPGAGGRKSGRKGTDVIVLVPVGTVVFDDDSGELMADLAEPGATAVVAPGGTGGAGNMRKSSSVNRTPTIAGAGEAGVERTLRLELRLKSDVAIVGPANAGRSTLLSALTNARPKIAAYPFTTIEPEPGVAFFGDGEPLTLLEIPAGERFLGHLARARTVLLAVDGSQLSPAKQLKELRALVAGAGPEAAERPQLIVVTKADLAPKPRPRLPGAIWVAAETGVGMELLSKALWELCRATPPPAPAEPHRRVSLRPARSDEPVSVRRTDAGFELIGAIVERLLERYDLDEPAAFDHFQMALEKHGISAALAAAGVRTGETVRVGDLEFEYRP